MTVPAGTTTYGVVSGEGTLRISGHGTLILTRDSDFTLPSIRQRQRVRILGGKQPAGDMPTATAVTADSSPCWRSAGLAAVAVSVVLSGLLPFRRLRRRSSSSRG